MNRRSFLRRTVLGIGAALSLTAAGFDAFAVSHGLRKHEPFPVWTVKWKQFLQPGWHATTKLNLMDGAIPPKERALAGIHYDLWRYDVATQRAWYLRRES